MSNRLRTTNSDARFFARIFAAFGAYFVVAAVLGIAATVVAIWAVIQIVQHFTG